MASKYEFLDKHALFKRLNEQELNALVAIAQERAYDDGAVVAFQGDVANSLYIVKSGRLYAETRLSEDEGEGLVVNSRNYLPGDYFEARWLFEPGAHPATVKATRLSEESAHVLVIHSRDFINFLRQYPGALEALRPIMNESSGVLETGLPVAAWTEAEKMRPRRRTRTSVIRVLPDELVEYSARRSVYYLLVKILVPLLLTIFVPLITYFLMISESPDSILYRGRFWISAVPLLLFGVVVAFQALDWSNDHFVITNKRLVHREFDLRTFRIDIKTARIDQIQSVEIEIPGVIANIFDFGTAIITTASQFGTIRFDNIDNPKLVKDVLDRLSRVVRQVDASREQTLMRESVEAHFHTPQRYQDVEDDEAGETTPVQPRMRPRPPVSTRLRNRFYWRVEEDGVITYRKHYIVLFLETAAQVIAGLGILVIGWLIVRYIGFTWAQVLPFLLFVLAIDFIWFIWDLEDWRNDIFQITDRVVIDIDRRPFGFGESRKQALLSNIQNVNAYTPGLLHTLFSYGNVDIETAGEAINIQFENVPYPSVIQSDIFQRLDDLQAKQFANQRKQRHKEYSLLLDVYKQSIEQDRIPNRTPQTIPDYEEEDIL